MPRPVKTSHKSKKEAVYTALLKSIVTGELRPGDKLVIDSIARKFGHSHIPVREAVQQLAANGFVEIRPYSGATVTQPGVEAISEILELLEALELIAARASCQRITEGNVAELTTMLEKMNGLQRDAMQWAESNTSFHDEILRIGGRTMTMKLLENVRNHWKRLRSVQSPGAVHSNITEEQREHWQILEALKNHDAARLETLLRHHNRATREMHLNQER